jgi:hypothetical protein
VLLLFWPCCASHAGHPLFALLGPPALLRSFSRRGGVGR